VFTNWIVRDYHTTLDMLGYIPSFLDLKDPRSARDQIAHNYIAGWSPFEGFKMLKNLDLAYPGDPITHWLAKANFRKEKLVFYEHSWFAIIQPSGEWEIARLD
jgi:hypothetical protein